METMASNQAEPQAMPVQMAGWGNCAPATVFPDKLKAVYFKLPSGDGYLILVVLGEKLTPYHTISLSPLRIYPPQYEVLACAPDGQWSEQLTAYEAVFMIYIKEQTYNDLKGKINIHFADGQTEVKIEEANLVNEAGQAVTNEATSFLFGNKSAYPSPNPPGALAQPGFGYSYALDFNEAFRMAWDSLLASGYGSGASFTWADVVRICPVREYNGRRRLDVFLRPPF